MIINAEFQEAEQVLDADFNTPVIINQEGGGGVVDQTYDATSPNAQSGIAVEQALNQYPDTSRFMSGVMGLVNRNGFTPTEQTYNPLSENAQSGKAVAQAIDTAIGEALEGDY